MTEEMITIKELIELLEEVEDKEMVVSEYYIRFHKPGLSMIYKSHDEAELI